VTGEVFLVGLRQDQRTRGAQSGVSRSVPTLKCSCSLDASPRDSLRIGEHDPEIAKVVPGWAGDHGVS
jgi:hypothetical protein